MKSTQKNTTNTPSSPPEKNKPKSAFSKFFSKLGYSIWMIVMVVGGVLAFLVSLFLL